MRKFPKRYFALFAILIISSVFASLAAVAANSNYSESSNDNLSLVTDNDSVTPENINVPLTTTTHQASPVKDEKSTGKPHDNIKNLILDIPETGESPLVLKMQIIDEITALSTGGEEPYYPEEIIEHIRRSIENNFWDNYHIKSVEAFKEDKQAAQKMRVLFDREKKSELNGEIFLECLIMLLQSDKKLVSRAMEDARNALLYISDPAVLDELNKLIEQASKEYSKAEEHIRNGDPVAAIEFYGKAWENAYAAISIADKNTVPKISFLSPENGSYTNISLQDAAGSVEDVALYTIKNASITVNGITSEIPVDEGRFSRQVTLVEGANSIQVVVKDAFGNSDTSAVSITLDTIPPEINIKEVEDAKYYKRDVLPLINISDINLQSSSVTLDDMPYSGTLVADEGDHTLEVYATDLAGNSAYTKVKFTLDKTPPKVEITNPLNSSYLKQVIEIRGSAADINLENVSLRIDDIEVSAGVPYTWDTAKYADTAHKIELYAVDKALNNNSVVLWVTVDNTPPAIELTNPSDDSFVRQVLNIEGNAKDANLASTSLQINGQEVSASLPYPWDTRSYVDGKYLIELFASDLAGNSANTDVLVTVDNTHPKITILSPSDNMYLRQEMEINASVDEANLQNISVRIDGSEVSSHLPYLWDTPEYSDNRYEIQVYAIDKAGNEALESINGTVDNTPPEVSFLSPLNNSYLSSKYLSLLWNGMDNYGIAIYELSLNSKLLDRTTTTEKAVENLEDRIYESTVQAFDLANNSASDTIFFTIDTIPPVIKISDVEGERYYNTSISPQINITDINLNSISVTLDGKSYNGEIISDEGQHSTRAYADDLAGNNAATLINFTIDKTAPYVSLTSPAENLYLNQTVEITGSVTDVNLDKVSLSTNGIGVADSLPYTWNTLEFPDGFYTIDLAAIDKASNSNSVSRNVTIDNTVPEVSIAEPLEGAFVRGTVSINGTANDVNINILSLKIDGSEVSDALPYAWATRSYSDGAHIIEFSTVDKAGNIASTMITVTVDNTLPAVTLSAPSNNSYVGKTVRIEGSASDSNLNSTALSIDGIEASSSLPYLWDTTGYSDGAHTIELSAMDRAGNSASTMITVIVDNTLPIVNLTAPANNSFVKKIASIEGNASDSNLNMLSLAIDGAEVYSSLPYSWDSTGYSDGAHTIRLAAWDRAGNEAAIEIVVTVDNTPPIVSIISPLEGALLHQIVEINGTIAEVNIHSINLTIDGAAVASSIPNLWGTSIYPDGEHRIELNVSDKANNYAFAVINATTDNTPPALAVSELNLNPTLDYTEYQLLITTEAGADITVNNVPIAVEDGSAIYKTNVTLGINDFVVTAIDLAGNPSTWKRIILVDEDSLPDWYEINVTGTDPLNDDSDSNKTIMNEAANGIRDDREDFDSDKLLNMEEFAYSLNPFNPDTEGDGLSDWYELRITGTDPLLVDSDENGVDDNEEDMDGDLLNNLMEQGYNTNPLSNDTDEDTLSDHKEILELKTNPLKKDTDNDYLDDSIELKPFFNTDPLKPDTNGNGILDGNETYEQAISNKTLGIEVEINASDNREGAFVFEDVGDNLALDSDIFIGKPVNIMAKEKFSAIKIKMYYNSSKITNESHLAMLYFDEANHSFLLLEKQGVNTEENYVWGETDHLSNYLVADNQTYYDRFLNANAPTIPQLKAGDEIEIYAKVHNLEQAEAKNVEVVFYNGDPDNRGEYIGKNVTPSIGKGQSVIVSMKWKVNFSRGLNIFIKVDPNHTVTEINEGNNIANRFLDNKSVDSDGDGLTDYDEVNGLRTAMGLIFFTNPNNPDTDGDGLDDGREMGPVMELTQGLKGRYYFLFSYPGTSANGAGIINSIDSDGDTLSDKDEYYFGSSGLDKDVDNDKLNDPEEYQLGTLPRDPDTDRDGLTDWWETRADASVNKYGATDPKKRDSDGDGAIDGGETNVYFDTPYVDINRDGAPDSGDMDLNGDGIIEMGEENYYETPPNNYTYFVDVFMVVDEEYKNHLGVPWNPNQWKDFSVGSINEAGKYFLNTFQIKLNITQIDDHWDSNDRLRRARDLLTEALNETNWIGWPTGTDKHNSDILVAFTGQDPGIISKDNGDVLGLAFPWDAAAINRIPPFVNWLSDNLVQHEVSHLFGADDYYDGRKSIMDKSSPWPIGDSKTWGNIWTTHEWDEESIQIIQSNKSEVSLFSEGGDYDITN